MVQGVLRVSPVKAEVRDVDGPSLLFRHHYHPSPGPVVPLTPSSCSLSLSLCPFSVSVSVSVSLPTPPVLSHLSSVFSFRP